MVDEAAVPEALPEVPAETGETVEEAELDGTTNENAQISKGTGILQKFVLDMWIRQNSNEINHATIHLYTCEHLSLHMLAESRRRVAFTIQSFSTPQDQYIHMHTLRP